MDPLTHYLSAKLTLNLFLKEKSDKLVSLFLLAAVFPDVDYVMRLFGRAAYLKYHRGITHSFVGIFILSLLLAYLFSRNDMKSFKMTFVLAYISMLIHILFDWTNSYGTQLFLPFSNKRAALDAIFILDIYILGIFIISLILVTLSKHNKFLLSLIFSVITLVYILTKIFLNYEVVKTITKLPIGSDKISVSAFPDMFLPHRFKCVIEDDKKYYTFDYQMGSSLGEISEYAKMPENKYISLVKESYLGKVFINFTKYPYYSIEANGENTLLKITDLKYLSSKDRKGFNATFLISKDMKILEEGFKF